MKQRRPKRRKTVRQPKKRLSPKPPGQTSTALPPRASNAVPDPIGTSGTPLTLRDAADQASFKAEVKEEMELRDMPDAIVIRATPHKEMLSWIEVLEALILELPKQARGIGHNIRPITGDDAEEIRQAVAILKAQPVVPTAPKEARAAGSTLKMIGERLGSYLLKQADIFVSEAVKSAGKEAGKRVVQSPFWWALATTLLMLGHSVEAWLR
jgi:hypothetical protein